MRFLQYSAEQHRARVQYDYELTPLDPAYGLVLRDSAVMLSASRSGKCQVFVTICIEDLTDEVCILNSTEGGATHDNSNADEPSLFDSCEERRCS